MPPCDARYQARADAAALYHRWRDRHATMARADFSMPLPACENYFYFFLIYLYAIIELLLRLHATYIFPFHLFYYA